MSTDLEFRPDLLELKLPTINLHPSNSSDSIPKNTTTTTIQIDQNDGDTEATECRTPTSPENKIPAILCCPPAPKKPKRAVSCKRKLFELEFYEVVAHEEIESFFRAGFGQLADVKRKCPCT